MEFLGLPQATLIFLAANVIISVVGFTNDRFVQFGVLNVHAVLKQNEWHRVLISGFLHADPFHLLVNMISLFFFGPAMEQVLGSQAFYLVYLGSLVLGNLGALIMHAREPHYSALGASGAVSGILFSFSLYAPFHMIYMFGVLPIPALLFAILFVAYSLYGMRAQNDNIGHDAHLFGAIAGVAITILLYPNMVAHFLAQITAIFG